MSKAVLQHAPRESASPRTPSFTASRGGLLQRKCACGGTPGATGECEPCRKKRLAGSNAPQLVARPVPLADKQVREVELGHTDCDWDRAVKPDEPFKPRSGDAKVKIGAEKCTLPCTAEHEATHLQQVGPLCKSYFTCYTGAPAKAKEAKDCKEATKPDERKKCEDLYTEFFRLECFVAVAGAWDAEAWECAAYKTSLACAEKELARGEKDCQGKLKEYKESAQKQIAKYCKAEKEKKEEGKKPEGSKEPEEPKKKPAEPEKPKEPEKKPKEPKEVLFRSGTLQRSSAAGPSDEPNEVPPIVNEVLRSPGQPLDGETRAFMEPRFGHDFSNVRVHTDAKAAESARAVAARAYTVGWNIVFGEGHYAPRTRSGQMLLAHELTHTVQQRHAANAPASEMISLGPVDSLQEGEAESASKNLGTIAVLTAHQVQRKTWETLPIHEEQPEVMAQDDQKKEQDTPEPKKPSAGKDAKKKIASCDRTILSEGSCADLVAGSKWICCDPETGFKREGKTKDVDGTACPSSKFAPIFTCDNNCATALKTGCDDNDHWMALPGKSFAKSKCGDVYTICAGGKKTTGHVRDKSERETPFEVSPGIQKDLGVSVGSSFKEAIYGPAAAAKKIDADACCNS